MGASDNTAKQPDDVKSPQTCTEWLQFFVSMVKIAKTLTRCKKRTVSKKILKAIINEQAKEIISLKNHNFLMF